MQTLITLCGHHTHRERSGWLLPASHKSPDWQLVNTIQLLLVVLAVQVDVKLLTLQCHALSTKWNWEMSVANEQCMATLKWKVSVYRSTFKYSIFVKKSGFNSFCMYFNKCRGMILSATIKHDSGLDNVQVFFTRQYLIIRLQLPELYGLNCTEIEV